MAYMFYWGPEPDHDDRVTSSRYQMLKHAGVGAPRVRRIAGYRSDVCHRGEFDIILLYNVSQEVLIDVGNHFGQTAGHTYWLL